MQRQCFRILLATPDEVQHVAIRGLLARTRIQTDLTWAADYYEALEAMIRGDHDVCLVDYHLGDYTGPDLLREALDAGHTGPTILLTGQDDPDTDMEAMRLGAADYLVKGQTGPHLLERSIRYAVERSQMLQALRELAIRDELTGLYNRREMGRILSQEVDRASRYESPVSVIVLGVDNLAEVASVYGYQAGDALLQCVAQTVRDSVRTTDRPSRHGIEELTIILPETASEDARVVAERIRETMQTRDIVAAGENREPVEIRATISAGVASFPADASTDAALLAAASQALYEARRRGHNCTVVYRTIEAVQTALP